jgi:putative FmdB family regulatory protein
VPTYSYTCKQCGYSFDRQQSFSDAALTECPRCQGALRKLFGKVGVVFKGSGFYRTDSRSGGSAAGDTAAPKPKPVEGGSSGSATSGSATSGSASNAVAPAKAPAPAAA